jgi:predicted transposase YbfD/YdcC
MGADTRYFIASITDMGVFVPSVRGHWEVENKLHWRYMLSLGFEEHMETIFKPLNARAIQDLLRPRPG